MTFGPISLRVDPGFTFANGDIDHGGFRLDLPDVEQVAYVWKKNVRFGSNAPFGSDEAEKYAKLFAAAPDLLEALVAAESAWGTDSPDGGFCPLTVLMRKAIAKATGSAPAHPGEPNNG